MSKRSGISVLIITALVIVGGLGAGVYFALQSPTVYSPPPSVSILSSVTGQSADLTLPLAMGRLASFDIQGSIPEQSVCVVTATLNQGEKSLLLLQTKRVRGDGPSVDLFPVRGVSVADAGMVEGEASLSLSAKGCAWMARTTSIVVPVRIDFAPPTLAVTSSQHYINHGGADVATYSTSDDAVWSGVRVGPYSFVGHKVPGATTNYFSFFVYSYDVKPETPIQVVAVDAAGNEAVQTIVPARFYPKEFRHRDIEIVDSFIQTKVADIIRNTPSLSATGTNLNDFLLVNSNLRKENVATLVELSKRSEDRFYWKDAFIPLRNASIEANFADYRSYMYNGQKVDEQVHLGFDMAVTKQYPISASGAGKVVMAQYLGIYGNTVVIDHGYGLQSLYAHLSGMNVKEGEMVTAGQIIGNSGETGMAGGDHLHFSMLIDGIQTNPVEFWDQHWIDDHVYLRIDKALFGK